MYKPIEVAQKISKIIESRGETVNAMLAKSGLSKDLISTMKKGSSPSVDKIALLADTLDCSVDYLLGRTDVVSVAVEDAPTQDEMYLISEYRRLNAAGRAFIRQTITTAIASGMYDRDPHNADLAGA